MVEAWTNGARDVVQRLRQRTLCPNQVSKAKKKKKLFCFRNPTDPTFLEPTLYVFETSENFSSIFRVF